MLVVVFYDIRGDVGRRIRIVLGRPFHGAEVKYADAVSVSAYKYNICTYDT